MGDAGFVYVASRNPLYYAMAVVSCESLKMFFPDCHVTLFTHDQWVDEHSVIFDNVVTGIPWDTRSKMWCMARTPYDTTVYLDADSIVLHRDIREIFDLLEDNDFGYIKPIPTHARNPKWAYIDKKQTVIPSLDGSFLLYKKSKPVVHFLESWYNYYHEQKKVKTWPHKFAHREWKNFDMFTMWAMLESDEVNHPSAYKKEYEIFRKLKRKQLDNRYNSAWFIKAEHLSAPLCIGQIDMGSYKKSFGELYHRCLVMKRGKDGVTEFS